MSIFEDFKAITSRAEIPAFLREYGMNRIICEVGVRFGYHFRQLLACDPQIAIGVDLWTETGKPAHNDTGMNQRSLDKTYQDVFHQFLFDSRCKLFRGYSVGAAQCVDPMSLDFCYIDADHTYAGCRDDLNRWWPKVRRGGMFAGHDYVEEQARNGVEFGVIRAVTEFVAVREIPAELFSVTKGGYRSWMVLKVEGE